MDLLGISNITVIHVLTVSRRGQEGREFPSRTRVQ